MGWSPDYPSPEQRARLTRKQRRDRRIEQGISTFVLIGFVVLIGGGVLVGYVIPAIRSAF